MPPRANARLFTTTWHTLLWVIYTTGFRQVLLVVIILYFVKMFTLNVVQNKDFPCLSITYILTIYLKKKKLINMYKNDTFIGVPFA